MDLIGMIDILQKGDCQNKNITGWAGVVELMTVDVQGSLKVLALFERVLFNSILLVPERCVPR